MVGGQAQQMLLQVLQLLLQQCQCLGGQQRVGRVHHVLGGGAPVQPGQAFRPVAAQPVLQRLDHGHRQRAGLPRTLRHLHRVQQHAGAGLFDGLGGRFRDQVAVRLGPGQLRFKAQHGLHPQRIAEQLRRGQGVQVGADQGHG